MAKIRCNGKNERKALEREEAIVTEGDILKSCYRGAASDKSQHVARRRWLACSRDGGQKG